MHGVLRVADTWPCAECRLRFTTCMHPSSSPRSTTWSSSAPMWRPHSPGTSMCWACNRCACGKEWRNGDVPFPSVRVTCRHHHRSHQGHRSHRRRQHRRPPGSLLSRDRSGRPRRAGGVGPVRLWPAGRPPSAHGGNGTSRRRARTAPSSSCATTDARRRTLPTARHRRHRGTVRLVNVHGPERLAGQGLDSEQHDSGAIHALVSDSGVGAQVDLVLTWRGRR